MDKLKTTEIIPRKCLFGNVEKVFPQISPDGHYLAYLAPVKNTLNIWLRSFGGKDDRPITFDKERGIRPYFWLADSKHIVYPQDIGGNEQWRLYMVSVETAQVREITPFTGAQVRIIMYSMHYPNKILIEMNKDDVHRYDAYCLDLITNEITLVAKNPGNVIKWLADWNLRIYGCITILDDSSNDMLIYDNKMYKWKIIAHWDVDNVLKESPYGILEYKDEKKYLYLKDSRGFNTDHLIKMDISTGEVAVIVGDPLYDIWSVVFHPETHHVQAASFYKERLEWVFLDESIQEDFNRLKKNQRGDISIISRSRNDNIWIISYTSDDCPTTFYIYKRNTKEVTLLFESRPALRQYKLTPMEPISYLARDGLNICGYLTLPMKRRQKVPMVLYLHGGPWARDSWGLNLEAQWFANRGYACLQINYRGSTGYGKGFLNAGNGEWGQKMHNDVVDAVYWAINQGFAAPKKIAIYGYSYGGYAALVGAAFTPDLFCCAVDAYGMSNLISFIRSFPEKSSYAKIMRSRVGDPDTDEEFLRLISPLFKVDQIKIPVMIAQGVNDPRVRQRESEQIVEALKARNIPCEYLLFQDEGHGFIKPANRLKFFATVENFLAKYLGGYCEEEA